MKPARLGARARVCGGAHVVPQIIKCCSEAAHPRVVGSRTAVLRAQREPCSEYNKRSDRRNLTGKLSYEKWHRIWLNWISGRSPRIISENLSRVCPLLRRWGLQHTCYRIIAWRYCSMTDQKLSEYVPNFHVSRGPSWSLRGNIILDCVMLRQRELVRDGQICTYFELGVKLRWLMFLTFNF